MTLRKIRTFRPGTTRFAVSGLPGTEEDDRAIVSVWPPQEGEEGCGVLLSVVGRTYGVTARFLVPDVDDPEQVRPQALKEGILEAFLKARPEAA